MLPVSVIVVIMPAQFYQVMIVDTYEVYVHPKYIFTSKVLIYFDKRRTIFTSQALVYFGKRRTIFTAQVLVYFGKRRTIFTSKALVCFGKDGLQSINYNGSSYCIGGLG